MKLLIIGVGMCMVSMAQQSTCKAKTFILEYQGHRATDLRVATKDTTINSTNQHCEATKQELLQWANKNGIMVPGPVRHMDEQPQETKDSRKKK